MKMPFKQTEIYTPLLCIKSKQESCRKFVEVENSKLV